MSRKNRLLAIVCCLSVGVGVWNSTSYAQEQAEPSVSERSDAQPAAQKTATQNYDNSLGTSLLKNLADDQKAIWTSPADLRWSDMDWLLPLGVAAGGLFATDTETEKHLSNSPSRLKYSKDFSNYGLASFVAASGGLFLWGKMTHDEHKRETGFLAGEAALNSLAATYALKYTLGRERPLEDNYQGRFWQGGDSFPSEHAAAAWSMAGVIAHEYPGPLPTILAYGLAAGISSSRISAKQHFPSDVLIGSAIGWFVGQEVYRHHHDPDLAGGDWETYAESRDDEQGHFIGSGGSPYVELDSWVYPAIERLAAMGLIHSEFLGMRPWTRIECADLVEEAGDEIRSDASAPSVAHELYTALQKEFSGDLEAAGNGSESSAHLESLYSGVTGIAGPPLHDSYHFGQTIINNYGRPYEQGLNAYDGFSAYGTAGRFTLYVRGEYQHAPFAPAYSLAARQAIATADSNPLQPATPFTTVDRFSLLDTYAAANVVGWNLAFGKQSLWWGPDEGGAVLFSDNAPPIYMFRASRISPVTLPLISRLLGPMKWDFFFGKLSGHQFPARPLIHGEKMSFKPTPNLELGFSRTTVFSGVDRAPLTLGLLARTYFSAGNGFTVQAQQNSNLIGIDPGDRKGGFDFSYRVPYLRNWLTLYSDSFSDDDPSPLANPPRAPFNPGIYMPQLPFLPKVDFRVEAVYTDVTGPGSAAGGQFVYFNTNYHDSYTNDKNLLGSWIGRDGKGLQAWTTYHVNSRSSLQFAYRNAKVSKDFIPSGETVNDGSVKIDSYVHNDVELSGSVQYEKWLAPLLAPGPQTNWTASMQVTFYPHSLGF
jgi:membrane-associated phospholipid phosphatase